LKTIKKSIELFDAAKKLMPGGVNSPVRAFKNINGSPIFIKSAKGAILKDVDNNQYIDYIGSWGPMIMGHSNPLIINAVKKQLELGTSYGAPTQLESDLALLIKEAVPSMQKIRMVNSGTEATMSAIRLARGYTGKNKIIKFDGCYHGHSDSLLIKAGSGVTTFGLPDSPGVPKDLAKHTLSCEFNNEDAFIKLYEKVKDDLAGVIIEPIAGNMGFIKSHKNFLKLVRYKTKESKSVLIFDEVMSGFRVSLGGAQEVYKIKPDLTTLGKVIGGGLPVGAFGGSKKIMDYLAPEGPVYQAGTLSGNPLAMAAGKTLISELIKRNPYEDLEAKCKNLLSEMRSILKGHGVPFSYDIKGGMFGFFLADVLPKNLNDVSKIDNDLFSFFIKECIKRGIYFAPSKFEAGFISTKHSKKLINETIKKIKDINFKEYKNEI